MRYQKSLRDKIAEAVAPVMRKTADQKVKLGGTEISVLRIRTVARKDKTETNWGDHEQEDVFGDSQNIFQVQVIDQVIINYPFSRVEEFTLNDPNIIDQNPVKSIDLMEFLPITMRVLFEGKYEENAISLKKNDIIVDIIWDENDNPNPILLQVQRRFGSYYVKRLANREYELSLYRGNPEPRIQQIIDNYLQEVIENPE